MFLPSAGEIRKANSSSLAPASWNQYGRMRALIQADHSLSGITSGASIIFSFRLQLAEWNNNNYIDAEVTITPLLTCVTLTIALPVQYLTRTRTD